MSEHVEAEIVEDTQIVLSEIKYPVSQTDLKALLEEYKEIPNIDPDADDEIVGKQYQMVLKGHKAFVKARTSIEKTRKTLKQPALDYGKTVDEIAKEFQAMIKTTEDKLFIERKKVEDNEARKQRDAEEAEEARINNIKRVISSLKDEPMQCINKSAKVISEALELLEVPSRDFCEEFYDEAFVTYENTHSQLTQMYNNQLLVENAEKIQAEAKAKADAEEAEKQSIRDAEQKKLDDERAEFENQKRAFETHQRAIQEEADRKEAERLADELQKQQDVEAQKRAKENKENFEALKRETLLEMDTFIDNSDMLDAIINNIVPNIKWVQNGN